MKKIVAMLSVIIGVIGCIACVLITKDIIQKEQEKKTQEELFEKYAAVLRSFKEENENPRFALTYIDDDDIPELLLYPDYYGAGTPVTVYSIYNGEAILVGSFGSYSELLYGYKASLIIGSYPKYGEHYGIYSLNNGVATEIGRYEGMPRMWYGREDANNYYNEETDTYYLGGVEVSQEEFLDSVVFLVNDSEVSEDVFLQSISKAISGNTIYIAGSGVSINSENIEKMIQEPSAFEDIGEETSVPYRE